MALSREIRTKYLIIIELLLSLAIFIIDLLTPLGIADGICYIAVMLLSVWINDKRLIIVGAATGIVLIIAGYFLSPPAPPVGLAYVAITNRVLSVVVIIICAFVIVRYKKLESSEIELKESLMHEKELSELKSRFVSMASHEFRTPLTTILSSLSLISKYNEAGEKEKPVKHIMRIKSAVIHLTDLINDVLSLSKLEEGRILISIENFSVKGFIQEIVKEMQLVAKTGQQIVYEHVGEEEIIFDKKILKQVILNLVSNAIKFSYENTVVYIYSRIDNSGFTLVVKDAGIGISGEDQKHLFERFFRGDNASSIPGTGLGLNILAKHVELLKGKVTFTSKLGEGTTFTIEFALSNEKNPFLSSSLTPELL